MYTENFQYVFGVGKKKPPASLVCCTAFRDVLSFSCVDNSSKYPIATTFGITKLKFITLRTLVEVILA